MTYRDPNQPLDSDSPTQAYRLPDPDVPDAGRVEGPAPEPAPTTRAMPAGAGPRPSRARWAVAIVVVALVVAASGLAAVLLTGRAPSSTVLGWAPADAVGYMEVRLDLPGDQRANLGSFLAHFPGFDDRAALDVKLNETLDQVVYSASRGDQSYIRDIEPWFEGEVAFVLGELPDMAALDDPSSMQAPEAVVLLSVKDSAKAQAWLDATIGDGGTTEDHNGTTVTLLPSEGHVGGTLAYAVTAEVVAIGELVAVRQALDTNGESGLARDAEFSAALAASERDHVGFMYLDMRAYMEWALGFAEMAPADQCGSAFTAQATDLVPPWIAAIARVEGDALRFDARVPLPDELPYEQENHVSAVAHRVPASTIALIEGHDVGRALLATIDQYRDDPNCAEAFRQIEEATTLIGGFENALSWLGDTAVAINQTEEGIEGGLVVAPTDVSKATTLLGSLRTLVSAGGGAFGVTVTDEQHGEATITTVDFGDLETLSALTGTAIAPGDLEMLGGPLAHVQLSWSITDDLVVIGVGPEFVRHVLETDSGASLAASDRFSALLDRAGGESNLGTVFVDIAALRELSENELREHPAKWAEYEREVRPFLLPFDAFLQSSVLNGDRGDTHAVITVK